MAKFHINPTTGNPGACRATEGNCPFGGPESHYSSLEKAREAFELSMAAESLAKNEEVVWGEWKGISSGYTRTKKYKNTQGFIAYEPMTGKYLAYGKSYDPNFGPVRYPTEEEALAHVALSYEEINYTKGMNLPSGVKADFATVDGEVFKLEGGVGITNFVSQIEGKDTFYTGLKAIDKLEGFAKIETMNPTIEPSELLQNGRVYKSEGFADNAVYIVHNGAIFKGDGVPF